MLLEKMLQSQGFGSRKHCQQLIKNGAVTIMGETLGVLQAIGGGIIICAALLGRIAEGKRYE